MPAQPLLPTTKVGAGDKQKAYIVRQPLCLKIMLGLLIVVGMLSTALLLTTYEVRVQRRESLHGMREHREEEHASHMRVMRLSMLLQQHLEDDVHDLGVLTTYRAWLMRAVGDYQTQLLEKAQAANCSPPLDGQLKDLGSHFDADIDGLLKRLWDDVVTEGKAAQKSLHNITRAIVSELRQDASEQGAYERLMDEAGEQAGRFGYHEKPHDGEAHGHHGHHHMWDDDQEHEGHHAANPYPDEDEGEHAYAHGHGGHRGDDEEDDGDDDEEHLATALEALLAHLQYTADAVIHVSNQTIDEWEQILQSASGALKDEEQEVDMERIDRKIELSLNASNLTIPAYNETEYDSRLSYMETMLRKARLAPYQKELIELLTAWQQGDVKISKPLSRIEELIDEDVLEPDVLLVNGGYEHYRYDD